MKETMVSSIFEKFLNKNALTKIGSIEEKSFIYCIIYMLPLKEFNLDNYLKHVENIFREIIETRGDVNQFCCGTILALYGVPIDISDKYQEIKRLLSYLTKVDINICLVAGETRGYYGAFGFEKRAVVTAINSQIAADYQRIINATSRQILVHKALLNKIGVLEGDIIAI